MAEILVVVVVVIEQGAEEEEIAGAVGSAWKYSPPCLAERGEREGSSSISSEGGPNKEPWRGLRTGVVVPEDEGDCKAAEAAGRAEEEEGEGFVGSTAEGLVSNLKTGGRWRPEEERRLCFKPACAL